MQSREPVCSFCLRQIGREIKKIRARQRHFDDALPYYTMRPAFFSTPPPTAAAQIRAAMAQDEAEMDGLVAAVVARLEEIAP